MPQQQPATNDLVEQIVSFYGTYYADEISTLAQHYPKEQTSLTVNYADVCQFDADVADDVLAQPDRMREYFETALAHYDLPADIDLSNATVRFSNVEVDRALDELRNEDVEKLRAVKGQISKASAIRPVIKEAAWECQRCGTPTYIPVETELKQPHECQGCERQGPFSLDYEKSHVRNHQLIRIKQPPEEATTSTQIGNEIDAHIEGDLVGYADAGERADINGVLQVETNDDDPTLDFYFDAQSIDKRNDDFRDLDVGEHREEVQRIVDEENPYVYLAESIAPGITGGADVETETPWGATYDKYWWVRLAAGIANLFGGWRRPQGDGTHIRGSSHTLFIGDPSTGKSTIMEAIEKISPRSASESGKNASGPGLTAAAVRDDFGDSQWSLEAGALVKAHKGVACIDEIDKMEKDGLSRLHSALEKQRLEINKAGIDATLKCETSLLAAGNPADSRFDHYQTDHSQIDIVGSLLDRFDLVFTFKDVPDREKDREIARTTIEQRTQSGMVERGDMDTDERTVGNPTVDIETMKAWVALAQDYQPVITDDEVKERLQEKYVEIRAQNQNDDGDDEEPVPATVRTLDGLLRLAEASARVRLSDEVQMIDAEMAIALVNISLNDIGYDPETGKMDADYAGGRGSWSQKDRRKKIKGIIQELNNGGGADVENVIQTAVSAGIEEENAADAIDAMMTKGDLYQPSGEGSVQVV